MLGTIDGIYNRLFQKPNLRVHALMNYLHRIVADGRQRHDVELDGDSLDHAELSVERLVRKSSIFYGNDFNIFNEHTKIL